MSPFDDADRFHMQRALALAERGLFTTTPNPRVGCVIAKDGAVVGEGFHARAGDAHAEVVALADARAHGHDLKGATLYVTLEPCNHAGRTPPCVDAILAAGIARVVLAVADPNPEAAHGTDRLRAGGVMVDVGLCENEARELNIGFVSRMTRGRPWVRTKIASSLDGRTALASGESQWITGEPARADGHAWRARACVVLTGVGTVLQDDPRLDVRAVATTRQPRRVIVDRNAEVPPTARVLADANAMFVTAGGRGRDWPATIESVELPDDAGRVDLPALMRLLAARGVNEVHVEAGARLNAALLDAHLIDEIVLYLAPSVLGDPARGQFERPHPLAQLADRVALGFTSVERVGDDLRVVARVLSEGGR